MSEWHHQGFRVPCQLKMRHFNERPYDPCPYRVGRGTDLVGPTSGCQCPARPGFVSIENYNVDQLDFGAWLS